MLKNRALLKTSAVILAVVMLMQLLQLNIYAASNSSTEKEDDPYFEGAGVSSDPFIIDDADTFAQMAELINGGKKEYIDAYYVLGNDINLSAEEWEPVGNVNNKFKGIFDGRGYNIYDLNITNNESSVGLFGYIYNGTVKNVNLIGGGISGKKDIGSIAGYNAGTITGCTSTLMLSSSGMNTGGIVGRNSGTVENCVFNGTIVSSDSNTGGIAGINSGTIDGCIAEASIVSEDEYAGGITGSNSGTVINSGSLSYVVAVYAGGIAGNNTGKIENSYNIGDVGEGSEYAGGIAGKNSKTITNCYNGEFISVDAYVGGGIVGYNSKGTVSLCYYLSTNDSPAVGEKAGGTIEAEMMKDKNMRSEKFAETLNENLKGNYKSWNSSVSVNDGFPVLLIAKESDLKIVNGEQYQTGDATPASLDGKTSMVKYTAYASKWFTGGTGQIAYEIVSFDDGTDNIYNNNYYNNYYYNNYYYNSRLTINEDTGYIVFEPLQTDANKEIEIVVTARDSEGYCTGNVTITINVNDIPENQMDVYNSYINLRNAKFDKASGTQYNLSIDVIMTLSNNDLLKIVNGDTTLENGVDYTIKNDYYVTIKRAYLSTLDLGENTLKFIFTKGASPELVIDVMDTSLEKYTVKFMDGYLPYHVVEDIPYGTTIDLPENPTKSNATFSGWYEYSNGGGEKFTNKTKVNRDINLYAYWKYKDTNSSSSSSNSKVKTYTIKASAGKGGTISPSGSQKLEEGDSYRYTITPDKGYIIADVLVDGVSRGEITSYRFDYIDEGHTIKATFKEDDGTGSKSVHRPYMRGYSDDTFRPDQPITRSEAAVIISRISDDFDEMVRYENTFYDVNGDIWYQKYVGYAVEKKYINGYEGDIFRPDNNITRAEFCTLVHKYLGLKLGSRTTRFIDCKGHWADYYIKDLVDIEAINGYQTGLFNPDGAITRAEAAKIINAVRNRTPNIEPEMDNPFVDIDHYHWAYYEIMEATVEHMGAELHKVK